MNPQIRHAQRACEAAKARQAIVVFIDESGQYAVASYGETFSPTLRGGSTTTARWKTCSMTTFRGRSSSRRCAN